MPNRMMRLKVSQRALLWSATMRCTSLLRKPTDTTPRSSLHRKWAPSPNRQPERSFLLRDVRLAMKQGPVIVASDHLGSDNARIRMGLPDFLRIPDNNELRARLPLYRVHDWLNHHGGCPSGRLFGFPVYLRRFAPDSTLVFRSDPRPYSR